MVSHSKCWDIVSFIPVAVVCVTNLQLYVLIIEGQPDSIVHEIENMVRSFIEKVLYNNPCTFFSLLLMTTSSTFSWIKWWLVIMHKLRIWSSILIQFSLYFSMHQFTFTVIFVFCYVLFSFVKVMLELSFMCKYLCINVMHNNDSVFFFLAQLHHPCNFSSQSGSCNIWCNKDFTWSWP